MSNVMSGKDFSYDDDRLYDINIIAGFARYLIFGLPPGSFEGACITGDYELAMHKASAGLRPRGSGGFGGLASEDVVANLVGFAKQNLPDDCKGGPLTQMRWCCAGGLSADKDQRVLYKLGHDVRWIKDALERTGLVFDWETGEYGSKSD